MRFPSLTAGYIVKWVDGMKRQYDLTMDFIGIWNEKGWGAEWVVYTKTLRRALDAAGYANVRIVVSDSGWEPAGDVRQDQQLAYAVHAIGAHYPGTFTTQDALLTEKALWASEDWSTFNDDIGAGCWARLLNWNYVNGLMTSTISWNTLAAYYDELPYARCGLMTANSPWRYTYMHAGRASLCVKTDVLLPILYVCT
jgi:galactosylceramidase